MDELLSYRLTDLLLFSEQTYLRQFELFNQWLYPLQYLAYSYGLLFLYILTDSRILFNRSLFTLCSAFWLISAYGYLWKYYSDINWMADYFVGVFILQALLVFWAGLKIKPSFKYSRNISFFAGILLWIMALLIQPVFEILDGHDLSQVSSFSLTPDSLSITAIGLMLIYRLNAWLFLPTCLWLIFSCLTYLSMDSHSIVFPALALSFYFFSIFQSLFLQKSIH